jgi:hypothetical protein
MEVTKKQISEMASLMGKIGGNKLKKSKPADYYKKIGSYGAKVRWSKRDNSV